MKGRLVPFVSVGALGFLVQIAALYCLTAIARWPYLAATSLAVELAVAHNFFWHERWTWRDRTAATMGGLVRFVRFHVSTGITSIAGNVILTAVFVEACHFDPVAANVIAIGLTSVVNFLAADRWVFAAKVGVALLVAASPSRAMATEPTAATIEAWNQYAVAAETRLATRSTTVAAIRSPTGGAIDVPGGMIHRWDASTLVRGVTVDQLLEALMHPGTPPPQEDVLESRVLSRSGDTLRVYLKLIRRTIITVTYDTEHEVTFCRWSPRLATSRSVATSIAEADGPNRGFLWRLNSYWRYTETADGVIVELESLSLSRAAPALVRAIAAPIVDRIARESIARTLEALRRHVESEYAKR